MLDTRSSVGIYCYLTVCSSRLFKLEKAHVATKKDTKKPSKTTATVTRIKANDTKDAVVKKPKAVNKEIPAKNDQPKKASKNPLKATGGYFKGAWEELRQVRWPNRRATWSLTAAMLVFTAFFVVLILLLDAFFKYIFQLILG